MHICVLWIWITWSNPHKVQKVGCSYRCNVEILCNLSINYVQLNLVSLRFSFVSTISRIERYTCFVIMVGKTCSSEEVWILYTRVEKCIHAHVKIEWRSVRPNGILTCLANNYNGSYRKQSWGSTTWRTF